MEIYSDGMEYTHAARQLEDGRWTSKIGAHQDLEHITLDCLLGDEYGQTVHVMKRAIPIDSA